ncbi:hypothetical protein GGF37_001630, partial [Kickxella alabastrina]
MKWALLCVKISKTGKQLDTSHISDPILYDRMEYPIERILGTSSEDYSFGDKGLQYDFVAKR